MEEPYFLVKLEGVVERGVGADNAQASVQKKDRLPGILKKRVSIIPRLIQRAFERIYVLEAEDGAINLGVPHLVGTPTQHVPPAALFMDFAFVRAGRVDGLSHEPLEVGDVDIGANLSQVLTDVSGDQIEQFFSRRREPPDAQVAPDHHYGDIDVGDEVQ